MRRFQIKFVLEGDYQDAVASLEKINCSVKPPPAPQDVTEQTSKGPSAPIMPQIFAPISHPIPDHNPSQRSPPRTPSNSLPSSTSSDSTVTATPFVYTSMLPPKDGQQPQPFIGIEQSKADPKTPIRREGFKRLSGGSFTSSTNAYPSSPPEPYQIPDTIQDLPPPRPPPDLSNHEQLKISTAPVFSSGRSSLASVLPPLPQPTPVGTLRVPSRAQTSAGYISQYMPTPDSNLAVFRQTNGESLNNKHTTPVYPDPISQDLSNFPPNNNRKQEDRLPLQPPIPEQRDIHNHLPYSGSKSNATSTRVDAPVGSKRGKKVDDNEDVSEHKQKKRQLVGIDGERARGEEDFAQMEEFIINAIHDDNFVRLVERIGGIWQRMGFEKAVPKLFTEE
ncbi:hypothetical protein C7212DRAFT_361295 [Tuber magnatum]|uniref:Uncharacterized protein n=1 Tax=Tuber magnatum TaxID=42249 RepID=A0A317T3I4_9PEZI|nr:hypothetical protein C7212DRAFT_361295 [Tuber magnatum]